MILGAMIAWFWWAVLALAAIGTLASTVYLGMVLVAAWRFLRRPRPAHRDAPLPPVSVVKPLCGAEPRLEANLESFFLLDYPAYEILFAMRSPEDGALPAVEALHCKYPRVPVQVIFSGEPRHANPKVTSLEAMIAAARHDIVVISDSDIRVAPDFLRQVVPPLHDAKTGLVTCLYRGVPTRSFWSRLEALELSVELPSGVLVADMLEGMKFALGAVMATRKDVLRAIGGIGIAGDYYSDDFVLGNLVAAAGYRVELSSYLAEHVLSDETFSSCFRRQLRWNRSTRYSRPKGHLGTGLTFAMPYGILGAIAGIALGRPGLGLALLVFAALRSLVQGLAIGGAVLKLRDFFAEAVLYAAHDLIGFAAWVGSFTGREFRWRGARYSFGPGGRVERHAPAREVSKENLSL